MSYFHRKDSFKNKKFEWSEMYKLLTANLSNKLKRTAWPRKRYQFSNSLHQLRVIYAFSRPLNVVQIFAMSRNATLERASRKHPRSSRTTVAPNDVDTLSANRFIRKSILCSLTDTRLGLVHPTFWMQKRTILT